MTNENLIRKIAAILAKANGTDNEHEADTFFAKAKEMMEAHGLTESDLETDKLDSYKGEFSVSAEKAWMKGLVNAIARYFECNPVWHREWKTLAFQLVGRDSNRITAEMMFPYIMGEVRKQAAWLAMETGKSVGSAERAVGLALKVRLDSMSPPRPQEVQDFMDGKMNVVTTTKNFKFDGKAKAAAEKISVNRQATREKVKAIA